MDMDWGKCFLCQTVATSKTRSTDAGLEQLADRLTKFKEAGGAKELDFTRINDGSGILSTLRKNKAVYHKDCYSKYNESHLVKCQQSHQKRLKSVTQDEDPEYVSRKRSKLELGLAICLFCSETDSKENLCAAGELHTSDDNPNASHVESLTKKWKEMALQLGELDIHARLSIGDVRASEMFYHKVHYVQFRNRYKSSLENTGKTEEKQKSSLLECYAMKQIVILVHQKTETLIDLTELEQNYGSLLESYNIAYSPHISRFYQKLKSEIPDLVDHTVKRKRFVSLKQKLDKEVNKMMEPESLIGLVGKVAQQIRGQLDKASSNFDGTFNTETSVMPTELLILFNFLVSGNNGSEMGFSLPVKTIAQTIMYNYRKGKKKKKNAAALHERHRADKETQFLQYIGLKVYSATRSRNLIDVLHKHGLCVSYDRVLRLTQGLGEAAIQLFERENAVVPGNLRRGVFTIGAKDNIDKDSSCTISKSHYHGTSLSLFQFPSVTNRGVEREYYKFVNIGSTQSKKVRELPCFYTNFDEIPDPPPTYFMSKPTVGITDKMNSNDMLEMAFDAEFKWLDYVAGITDETPILGASWSVYHSKNDSVPETTESLNSILPLLRENVNSFSMQKHCIQMAKAAVEVLNPGQVVVDVSDQPVYALSRRLQELYPNEFGPGQYFPVLGGLHIEKLLLEIHGSLVNGSGLSELLNISNVSVAGAGNVLVNVPRITSARYLLQVCLCAEYKALKAAHHSSGTSTDIQRWMDEMASSNDMFHYWKMIFDFQVLILQFVRAERERDFLLYVNVLKAVMKYIFAFNRYNYSRWLSVHVDDLMRLPLSCPPLYREFLLGNFVLQKSRKPFSAIALDQGHEQNNAIIKGVGGAVGLLSADMDSALRRWEVAGPDVCRLLGEYEIMNGLDDSNATEKHHEDYPAFQSTFYEDVRRFFKSFDEISNPFMEEELKCLHNGQLMTSDVKDCLANMLRLNEKKYQDFSLHRLEMCDIAMTVEIKNNMLHLPSGLSDDKKKINRVQQNRIELKTAKQLQVASVHREDLVKECFQHEVTEYPSSLTDGSVMYHSPKSDLLKRLRDIDGAHVENNCTAKSAMIVDLSVLINVLANRKSLKPKTFLDFTANHVYTELMKLSSGCDRFDIVTDSYPENMNLKESLQIERGAGKRLLFTDNTEFPRDFGGDFLRNSDNKRDFYPYVVEKMIAMTQFEETIVVGTRNEKSVTNYKGDICDVNVPDCWHAEADTRIILHVLNCIENGIKNITVHSNDTDVVVLLIAYMPTFIEHCHDARIVAMCGVGKNVVCLSINHIGLHIGLERCRGLLFFHSLTGSDYT